MKSLPFSILAAFLLFILGLRNEHHSWERRVRAQYTAESIPAIADLRLKTKIFRFEHGHLPGLARDEDHKFIMRQYEPLDGKPITYHDSSLQESIHFHALAQSLNKTDLTYQVTDSTWQKYDESQLTQHFFQELGLSLDHFTGRRLRPCHIQYAALSDTHMTSYLYVLGAFGNGDGLSKGTGYAVLEYSSADLGIKDVMEWRRYFSIGNQQAVLWFQPMNMDYNPRDECSHIVPIAKELFTAQTEGQYYSAIMAMNSWGWDTNIRRPGYLKHVVIQGSLVLLTLILLVVSGIKYGFAVTLLGFFISMMVFTSLLPM